MARVVHTKAVNWPCWRSSVNEFLDMPSGSTWELAGNYDPTKFFEALRLFANNSPLILYIEGTSPEIRKELLSFETDMAGPVRPGTTWPNSAKLHLRLTAELIDKLIAISSECAVPDYADHIVVYGDNIILDAYDFTFIPFYISGTVEEGLVKEFARIVGSAYRAVTV